MSKSKILIITPRLKSYSETFIRAHIERLPGSKHVLHNLWMPRIDDEWPDFRSFFDLPSTFLKRWRRRNAFSSRANKIVLEKIRQVSPDVILVEYGMTAALFVDALEKSGVPYVVHFHGFDASVKHVLKNYEDEYRRIAKSTSGVVAVSKIMQRNLVSIGFPENKTHYCFCGIDPDVCQSSDGGNDKSPRFLTVGRFVEKKSPHLALLAFDQVLRRCPEAKLLMIGEGPLLKLCKKLAHDLKLGESVRFLGSQSHRTVLDLMKKSLCFVQHSITARSGDSEGTPVAVMEAMASGLPVVATRHAGIQDVIEHEKTGFLVEEGDIHGMAKFMLDMIENPEARKRIGTAAREKAMNDFSIQKKIAQLAEILEQAAEKNE